MRFGAFLAEARELGISDVWGVEGPWIDLEQMLLEPELTTILDLEHPFSLGRRFDLLICTEVAEHVSLWWLRQNTLLFAGPKALQANGKLAAAAQSDAILSIVHPTVYLERAISWQKTIDEQSGRKSTK